MTLPKPIEAHPMIAQWVAFREDQTVEVRTGRVELGQGISTALVRIAAMELGLEEDQICLISGDTDLVPNEGPTVGSLSIQHGGMAIRHATSAARWECLARASELLQTAPDDLVVDQGEILKNGIETGLTYWSLTNALPLSGRVAEFSRPLGQQEREVPTSRFRRADMVGRLSGEVFIQDVHFPNMLHGRVTHPPFAATGLETSSKRVTQLAGNEVELFCDGLIIGVTADNEHNVAKAAARLREGLEWQLPEFPNPIDCLRSADTPETVHEEGVLPQTSPTVQVELTRPCIAHASVGPCCSLAYYSDNTLKVWSHSQGVFTLRDALSNVLDLLPENVVVYHVPGAGCYGHNGADDVALDAALLARDNPGQHVRVIWSRFDEFQASPLSPAMKTKAQAWLSNTGCINGFDVSVFSPGHSTRPLGLNGPNLRAAAYLSKPTPIQEAKDAPIAMGGGSERNATPLYTAAAMKVAKHPIVDIPYRASALRGLGAQVNVAVVEGLMDELAKYAELDPVEFRLAHLSDPRARAVIERVKTMADGSDLVQDRHRGMGFARYKNASGYFACIVEVEIGEDVRPIQVWATADVGEVIDISGTRNQIEGGILQSLSVALFEEIHFEGGRNMTHSWEEYLILGFNGLPKIHIEVLDNVSEPPLGCGEIATGPATAALLNAATKALGVRPSILPLTRENLVDLVSKL